MKKLMIISTAALIVAGSSAAFAQANMNAPQPNSTGTGVTQPGTSSTGVAIDRPQASGSQMAPMAPTTGSAAGNGANSASGSNSATNPKNNMSK